ncbi:uncharacterized protein LOC131604651 [Vicia villosa]|uniref:uncharacterized protein LOC131604651 n=1 Tax=Vicia villosa TaxID=3911 RepID=UPI00273CBDFC|nr:uncharacterized protein LOC131604651 [Vicia villosa]
MWSCDGLKSPGPDGYSFHFIKKCWPFLKDGFVKCFEDFYSGAYLSKSIISSFLTLVPKASNPLGLEEYRPICLVGCIYKVISKLLACRLKKVLNPIISNRQSAFVPGRQLLDGVLVANEVVDFAQKEGKHCLLFKVDFEKAYDKVNWNFHRYMFRRMGFGSLWMRWMEALVFSSDMLVLVNGSPTKEFAVERGLRQGDPLSPFLFLIVAEGLKGVEDKDFLFLGIPIGSNPRRIASWSSLVSKIKKRLSLWKERLLSFGGRITLLKSVLSSLAIITLSFYKAPVKIIKEITRIQSNFLWGGVEENKKVHWVCWMDLCLPIEIGGLGLRRMVIQGEKGGNYRYSKSVWWKDIISLIKEDSRDVFVNKASFVIGNGFTTSFWSASWLHYGRLRDVYPSLFSLSLLKEASVGSMGGWHLGVWEWGDFGIPNSNSSIVFEEMYSLRNLLQSVSPCVESKDKYMPRIFVPFFVPLPRFRFDLEGSGVLD